MKIEGKHIGEKHIENSGSMSKYKIRHKEYVPCCPICKSQKKNPIIKEKNIRIFYDWDAKNTETIELHFVAHKYLCPVCEKCFEEPIEGLGRYQRLTDRLKRAILQSIIGGMNYEEVVIYFSISVRTAKKLFSDYKSEFYKKYYPIKVSFNLLFVFFVQNRTNYFVVYSIYHADSQIIVFEKTPKTPAQMLSLLSSRIINMGDIRDYAINCDISFMGDINNMLQFAMPQAKCNNVMEVISSTQYNQIENIISILSGYSHHSDAAILRILNSEFESKL